MNREHADKAAAHYRERGYQVEARQSPIGSVGFEVVCQPKDGGKPIYAFTVGHLVLLIQHEQIARVLA